METLTEKTETGDFVFIEKKVVPSDNEMDPTMYFFKNITTNEIFQWKETKLLSYSNPKMGKNYILTYIIWVGKETKLKRWITKIQCTEFIMYIHTKNSIIKEDYKTGEKTNFSKRIY